MCSVCFVVRPEQLFVADFGAWYPYTDLFEVGHVKKKDGNMFVSK
jgi:hypothetical protein